VRTVFKIGLHHGARVIQVRLRCDDLKDGYRDVRDRGSLGVAEAGLDEGLALLTV
jgi:hypothetical protein